MRERDLQKEWARLNHLLGFCFVLLCFGLFLKKSYIPLCGGTVCEDSLSPKSKYPLLEDEDNHFYKAICLKYLKRVSGYMREKPR